MNILVTSAGRRTSLVAAFQQAAHPLGLKVLASDIDPLAPACALADGAFRVPRVSDPDHVPSLMQLVRAQAVDLIIPTIDTELPVLAEHAEAFRAAGALAVVSSSGFVAVCQDKWLTCEAFRAREIAVPDSWLPDRLGLRLPDRVFLKPRDGSASQHTYPCRLADLERMLPLVPNPIVQECLAGEEITVDALLDLQGRLIHLVPRKRLRTTGGESIQGVTLDLPAVDRWLERVLTVCSGLGARGPLTLQAFLTERGPVLTEINPRFGGGFPLAQAAGADYPAALLALRRGETLRPRLGQYRRGLYMTRHYTEVFLETLPWPMDCH